MTTRRVYAVLSLLIAGAAGCNAPEEKFGRTWYLDGAGNWGFGVGEVTYGLRKAGYKGQVSAFHWSLTMSPLADQVLKPLAGLGAARLAGCIDDYLRRYPNNEVNLIGLSAGAGVVLRAAEHVTPPHKVNNIILLAASVGCQYDVKPVLKNMRGKIYVYYSSNDAMLAGPVRLLGAFGGKAGDDPAGLCGLYASGAGGQVVNIPWRPRFSQYGWYGSHTSVVSEPFVQHILSRHVVAERDRITYVASAETPGVSAEDSRAGASGQRMAQAPDHPQVNPSNRGRPMTAPGRGIPQARSPKPKQPAQPRPTVYAPPIDDELSALLQSPVARPGKPATCLTLSRLDPRFPTRSRLADGLRVRLIGVPGATSARFEVQPARQTEPTVARMTVDTGQRYDGENGHAWAITLLRVDPPSQTAWLQIRPVEDAQKKTAKTSKQQSPTT
ncbi:MAG: hypothetical protein JXQ73_28555 [Phycisphaerae bacterium]|nr:hypothetical protein [Phycisphaerae bacterium]